VPKNFKKNVMAALRTVGGLIDDGAGTITFNRRLAHLYERRCRTYRTALEDPENSTFEKLEAAIKVQRTHRNMVDLDTKWLRETS
jgi:hypothetical protein